MPNYRHRQLGGGKMAQSMQDLSVNRHYRAMRRKRRERRLIIALTVIVFLLAITAALLWFFGYEKAFQEAWNTMPPSDKLQLTQQADGTVLLQWPQGAGTDYYGITVWEGAIPEEEEEAQPLYSAEVTDKLECTLPALPADKNLTIRVQSFAWYKTLTSQKARPGETALTADGSFAPPVVEDIHWESDPDADTLTLHYTLQEDQICQLLVSLEGSDHTWQLELTKETTILHFGTGQMFPMPEHGQTYKFSFGSYISKDSHTHQGLTYEVFSIDREVLLGTELILGCRDEGHNRYTLTWNETKGDGYEVQHYDAATDSWVTLVQIDREGERTYATGPLARYSDHRFRVIAVGDDSVTPDEVTVTTGASPIYSTIWPLTDQTVYANPQKTVQLGTAEKGKALCILDEENGLFKIRYGTSEGWIDSNYCMINLPDFIGDLCSYDITNSYASIFMVHGYEITGVTGTVVTGYEDVALSETRFLVPLLYPTALKLEKAAQAALLDGYRLKIYDSYRPGEASQAVRDATEAILQQPLPESTYNNIEITDMPAVKEGETLTYNDLMTGNGQYSINYFIAAYGSRHNYGVALDLTLEDADTGKEIPMQCAIHDLSHYAVLRKNTDSANILSKLMQNAGFGTLVSEWWHFQDNDALDTLELKALWNGITPQGWVADSNGWRYRRASGSFYKDCTKTIDGIEYTFDQSGYAAQP